MLVLVRACACVCAAFSTSFTHESAQAQRKNTCVINKKKKGSGITRRVFVGPHDKKVVVYNWSKGTKNAHKKKPVCILITRTRGISYHVSPFLSLSGCAIPLQKKGDPRSRVCVFIVLMRYGIFEGCRWSMPPLLSVVKSGRLLPGAGYISFIG